MRYFVSDVHLGAGTAEQARYTEQAFCRWLDAISVDVTELYLLGDIFDFWFEYRRVVPQGFVRTLARLAALTDRGVRVVMFTGNHDMWCYDYLHRECGVELHFRPEVMSAGDQVLHLAHGDNMNIRKQPMLRMMNAMFRSRVARWLFRWLIHPDHALKFGRWWSGKSRKSHGAEALSRDNLSYLVEYAAQYHLSDSRPMAYIFGHMHIADDITTEGGVRVLFLSDWSASEAVYAVMDDQGSIELKRFKIDETIS